jgi:carbon monoxide dehydrogenase subunit G
LNDPAILKEAIPGCQSLEKLSDTEMTATVVSKIGPVKATFNGNVTLSNIRPPEGYTISGEGKGGVAGFAKGGADVALVADGADTILRYTAKAQVGGKLAQVGARLIDATAKQMADQFFGAFAAKVGAGAPAAAAAPEKETTVEDVIKDVVVTAEAIEERAEVAAGRGFLGGPMMWGLIVLIVIVLLLIFLR